MILDFFSYAGIADMYVAVNNPNPPPSAGTNAFMLVAGSGANQLVLSGNDPRLQAANCIVNGPVCTVSIALQSATLGAPVYYRLTATPSAQAVNLTDGSPIVRTVAAGAYALFAYTPTAASNVTFSLTVYAGNASVAVSTLGFPIAPAPSTWGIASTLEGGVLTIVTSDPAYNPPASPPYPVFYLAVYAGNATAGAPATTFSIAAQTAAGGQYAAALADGVPQFASAQPHAMAYFLFNYTAAAALGLRGLDVYAAPEGGSAVQVYVNPVPFGSLPPAYPTPVCRLTDPVTQLCSVWGANAAYSSEGGQVPGFVSLVLPTGTLIPSAYLIAVLAVTPDAQSQQGFVPAPPALFTLSAASGAVLQLLQAGALLPGSVRASGSAPPKPAGYKYYSFTPSVYQGDSVVSVEVRSGSLEVYAIEYSVLRGPAPSAANPASLPGPGNSAWNSTAQAGTGQRSRYLRIPFAQLTPGCQASVRYGLGTCGIAIGVVGNPQLLGSAAYGISASQSNSPSSPLLLNEGTTQYLAIPASQCVFVSGIPSGASQRYGDYVYVANQVGTATMYINFRKQSFWVPGQGLLPDAVFTDQGGFESARVSGATQTLFITLCAPATGGSEHLITYRNAFDVQPLDDNQRTHGETACFNATPSGAGCVPAVYSFSVSDATASVSFTVQRTLGAVQAYVIQSLPSQPWVLPSPTYSTWSFYPTFFSPTLTIAPTDPLVTCKATADAPCLYYIALYPAENQPAAFDITASADALAITVLYDGQPASGSILDGASALYSYRPAAPGVPAPPVTFAWSNLFGAVSLYVTNTYAMGVSDSSQLPGPTYAGACQWVCTNFTSCAASPGDPCYTPTGPAGGAVVYTIAVVGASGVLGNNNEYALTATNAGDPTALALGVPTTDIVLFPFTNTTFVFELDESGGGGGGGGGLGRDIAYDVLISASVNHGAVQMLIAPAFGTGFGAPSPPPPACVVPAFGGTRRVCSGAVWQASSGYGDSVVYLSGAYQGGDVCAPVVPGGTIPPTTNASLCAAYFPPASASQGGSLRRGRYYVTLYTQVLSELSLLVQVAGVQAAGDAAPPAIRAVPRTVLADGQPLYLQTGPLTLCPGQARDNVTERCPPSPPAPAANTSWTATGSFTVFRIPAGAPMTYLNVIVERLCGGNATGDCGPELYIAVNGCAPNNCTAAQLTPYLADAYFAYPMREAVAGFQIPFDACYAPGYTPPLPNAAPDCIYAIGVFPRVGHGPSDTTPPGLGAPPQTYRITLSTPTGTQRIPQDCPGSGRLCTLPAQYVAPNQARFYESYASSNAAAGTAVALSAQLCYGTSLALYTCVASATTACSAVSRPSQAGRNYDASVTSNALGYAVMPQFFAPNDVYFFAVTGAALPGPPPANAPSYQLSLQHGSGMVLALGGSVLLASWDPSATFLTVTWTLPTLTYSGTGVSYPVTNLFFILHTFLLGRAYSPFQPSTPCGLDYLRDANVSDATAVFLRQADVCSVSGACSYVLTPPSTQNTYQLALSADCSARADPRAPAPGGACMPPGAESQRIAWAVTQDTPNPVPVSGTASTTATLTATPSPGAPPPPPAAAPAAAPSVAGPVVGSLLALLVAGGLGYAAFHYGLCASGGMSAAYSRLSTLVGGEGARSSASSAREALVDHPIFAAGGGDKGASAEAEYSQLA